MADRVLGVAIKSRLIAAFGLSEFPQYTVTVPHVAVGLVVAALTSSCESIKFDGLLMVAGQLICLSLLEVVLAQNSISSSVAVAGLGSDLSGLRSFFKLRFHQYLITGYSPTSP